MTEDNVGTRSRENDKQLEKEAADHVSKGRVTINLSKVEADAATDAVRTLTGNQEEPADAVRVMISKITEWIRQSEVLENESLIANHLAQRLERAMSGEPSRHVWTMWTLSWDPPVWQRYIQNVLPTEKPGASERIIAMQDAVDVLRLVALHTRNVRDHPNAYKLHLPNIDTKATSYEGLLLSASFAPGIEIVMIEDDHTDIEFRRAGTQLLALAHEHRPVVTDGFYRSLYDWLAKRPQGCLLSSDKELRQWLATLRRRAARLRLKRVDAQKIEKLEVYAKSVLNILNNELELDRTWWNDTAPDYERCFLQTSPNFLIPYLDEQWNALESAFSDLVRSEPAGRGVTFIELGCGTGRVLGRFVASYAPTRPLNGVIGVDFAPKMIQESKRTLAGAANGASECPYALFEGDVENFDQICEHGRIVTRPVKGGYRSLDVVTQSVKEQKCLVSIMDILPNTNPSLDRWKEIVNGALSGMKRGDMLFVSSYEGAHFQKEAYDLYTAPAVQKLTGKSVILYDTDHRDFASLDDSKPGGRTFFSHWFVRHEFEELLANEKLERPKQVIGAAASTTPFGLFYTARVR